MLLAHSPRAWMQEVHFFLVDHGGALVQGYVLSADEAASGRADVLIIDDVCSFLSRSLVVDLHRVGTKVVGIFDAADGSAGEERLHSLGVDESVRSDAPVDAFLAAIKRLADPGLRRAVPSKPKRVDREVPGGRVIAVAAAGGGTGATEIAIALATTMGSKGHPVALVDADELTPSIAQRLGLPVHPNLWTAIEVVLHGSGTLGQSVIGHSFGVDVVCGLPNPGLWRELHPGDVVSVVKELARQFPVVVANICSRIDGLPSHGGPGRFDVSRAVLASADTVVLVGAASPVGVARIVEWLANAQTLNTGKDVHLVLNRFPGGGYRADQIIDELLRFAHPRSVTVIPFDRRVQRAEWRGTPVAPGPFQRGTARVVSRLGETTVPV